MTILKIYFFIYWISIVFQKYLNCFLKWHWFWYPQLERIASNREHLWVEINLVNFRTSLLFPKGHDFISFHWFRISEIKRQCHLKEETINKHFNNKKMKKCSLIMYQNNNKKTHQTIGWIKKMIRKELSWIQNLCWRIFFVCWVVCYSMLLSMCRVWIERKRRSLVISIGRWI